MAAKKAPKKKSSAKQATSKRKGSGPSKSDFIREKLKAGLSAGDIVKAAAEHKMQIAPSMVYKLKSTLGGKKTSAKGKASSRKKAGKLSASDFIRKYPTKSANEIVELGKKKGLRFTISSVYQTRAFDKRRKGFSKSKPGPKRKTPVFQAFPGGGGGSEAELKKAALAVGFPRAREVVEELERGYMALLG